MGWWSSWLGRRPKLPLSNWRVQGEDRQFE